MNNRGAILRFCTAVICVIAFLTYTTVKGLFLSADSISVLNTENNASNVENENSTESVTQEINAEKTDISSDVPVTDTVSESKSVTVAASGVVTGKIIEKFISPYTANTNYKNIYLKNNTNLTIDLKEFADANLNFAIEKGGEPQVLIMHTHTTESYIMHNENYYTNTDASRSTDNEYNMAALGKIVSDKLNAAGIVTLHDTTQHDYPSYNKSYSRAAETIKSYVQKYPSIKIVIDLHRDAIAVNDTDKVKITTEIGGKKAAQIMLVMGSESGKVTDFPNWKENLKLATKLQQTLETDYPTLARSIHFTSQCYNQRLTTGSMLIEIGTDGNTFDEAKYSAELLADSLIKLLNSI